jgi:hypothetical protein
MFVVKNSCSFRPYGKDYFTSYMLTAYEKYIRVMKKLVEF